MTAKKCYNMYMTNNNFVYIWRESGLGGLPFYIGQGVHRKGNTLRQKYYRMYAKHRHHVQWKWDSLEFPIAEVHSDNLTKEEADSLERLLINRLGRIDNNTGILLNITEGGDANSVECESVRHKLKKSTTKNWKNSEYRDLAIKGMRDAWNDENRKLNASITVSERWKNEDYINNMKNKFSEIRNTESGKLQQSKNASQPIIYNGVEFASKKKLAEHYGLDPATCRIRLRKGIPLDAKKGYGITGRPKKEKR